jgi:hypothetical protein
MVSALNAQDSGTSMLIKYVCLFLTFVPLLMVPMEPASPAMLAMPSTTESASWSPPLLLLISAAEPSKMELASNAQDTGSSMLPEYVFPSLISVESMMLPVDSVPLASTDSS